HRVVEDVAHVQARARRVRQHLELVPVVLGERRARHRIRDVEGPRLLPDALPLRLDFVRLVSRCHRKTSSGTKKPLRGEAVGRSARRSRACLPELAKKQLLHWELDTSKVLELLPET